jgi:hypothetical protein
MYIDYNVITTYMLYQQPCPPRRARAGRAQVEERACATPSSGRLPNVTSRQRKGWRRWAPATARVVRGVHQRPARAPRSAKCCIDGRLSSCARTEASAQKRGDQRTSIIRRCASCVRHRLRPSLPSLAACAEVASCTCWRARVLAALLARRGSDCGAAAAGEPDARSGGGEQSSICLFTSIRALQRAGGTPWHFLRFAHTYVRMYIRAKVCVCHHTYALTCPCTAAPRQCLVVIERTKLTRWILDRTAARYAP